VDLVAVRVDARLAGPLVEEEVRHWQVSVVEALAMEQRLYIISLRFIDCGVKSSTISCWLICGLVEERKVFL
jgi:hypothetical protein